MSKFASPLKIYCIVLLRSGAAGHTTGANHAMYRVPGGPLIPVRRRVVRTQVPRSPDTPIRKRARPRRFNPETGREYSPLR